MLALCAPTEHRHGFLPVRHLRPVHRSQTRRLPLAAGGALQVRLGSRYLWSSGSVACDGLFQSCGKRLIVSVDQAILIIIHTYLLLTTQIASFHITVTEVALAVIGRPGVQTLPLSVKVLACIAAPCCRAMMWRARQFVHPKETYTLKARTEHAQGLPMPPTVSGLSVKHKNCLCFVSSIVLVQDSFS